MGQGAPEPRRDKLTSEIAAFARLIFALGVRDRERGEFWRYMNRVLISHPDKFTQAMMLAATGYHFRKLTEGHCE